MARYAVRRPSRSDAPHGARHEVVCDRHQPGEGHRLSKEPDVVSRAPAMGMSAAPYTFRASAVTGYPNVQGEVAQFIESLRRRRRDHRQSGQGAAPLSSASGRRKAIRERMWLTTVQDSNTRTRDLCRSMRNRSDVVQLGHKMQGPDGTITGRSGIYTAAAVAVAQGESMKRLFVPAVVVLGVMSAGVGNDVPRRAQGASTALAQTAIASGRVTLRSL